jgi:hypothetical protein
MGRKRVKPKKVLYVTDRETPHPSAQNYHAKVMVLMKGLQPGVTSIRVAHDDWCRIYQSKRCNCDPDLRLKTVWTPRPQS